MTSRNVEVPKNVSPSPPKEGGREKKESDLQRFSLCSIRKVLSLLKDRVRC